MSNSIGRRDLELILAVPGSVDTEKGSLLYELALTSEEYDMIGVISRATILRGIGSAQRESAGARS
jgi:hypothetical protein